MMARKSSTELPYRPCVGIMVLNRQGEVWMGRRMDAPNEEEGVGQWWQMPQGGIDEGEDPAQAALRELAEETGMQSARILAEAPGWFHYDLPRHLVGKAWRGRYRGQKQKWFAARFEGEDSEIDLARPGHEPEFDRWRWVPIEQIPDLVVPFKREVYRQLLTAFRHLAGAPRPGEERSETASS